MEGVPRMPMLSVELKFSPTSTDFSEKLLEYVARAYQEDPSSYRKEVEELNNLRENAIKASADFTGCVLLKKYFAQLNLLKSRFPMETNDDCAVSFTWYEKYSDMPNPISCDDIRYEMACILHNVGAMHSYLGSMDTRMSSEGMKIACTHFQCAAWTFQHLRGQFNAATFCSDFDKNILTWHTNLMLAQAQECILEKSLIDNRKYNIIAKIAIQVSEFYKECVKCLESQSVSDVVGSSRCSSWKKFVKMKEHYYNSVGYLYLGFQSEELQKTAKEQKMGERLAYFQMAADCLQDSLKLAQKESESVKQTLQFANDVVGGKLTNAKKENDFIYHDKIPTIDSLPDVKGAILVKGIPFDPLDVEISGPDIFQRLVPLAVHQASSLYSEEKATLLRSIVDKIERKNEELKQHLDALHMDQLHLDEDFGQLPLPESLLERCAAFNAKPDAVPELLAEMQRLSTMYSEVDYAMTELENQLNDAEKDIKSDLETYGKNDECVSLLTKLKELRHEFGQYREANLHATRSNTELHKAMAAHSDNLKTLSLPLSELKKQLPTLSNPGGQTPEGLELKRIRSKVDEMKNQREMLLEQLRKQIINDDLTKILLANREKDPKEIFEKSLKKHDEQTNLLEQNLKAQENILKALTESNAKYAKIRQQTSEIVKMRDSKILSLVAAFDVYVDLTEKSNQGIEFYKKFQKTLMEFNEKMAKFGENLNEIESKLQTKAEKLSAAVAAATPKQYLPPAEPEGPKLKDYLAYYKAKKAGSGLPSQFAPVPAQNQPQSYSNQMPVYQNYPTNVSAPSNAYQQQPYPNQVVCGPPPQQPSYVVQMPANQQFPASNAAQVPAVQQYSAAVSAPTLQYPAAPANQQQSYPSQMPAYQTYPANVSSPSTYSQQPYHNQVSCAPQAQQPTYGNQMPANQPYPATSAAPPPANFVQYQAQNHYPAQQPQQPSVPANQQQSFPVNQQQQSFSHNQQQQALPANHQQQSLPINQQQSVPAHQQHSLPANQQQQSFSANQPQQFTNQPQQFTNQQGYPQQVQPTQQQAQHTYTNHQTPAYQTSTVGIHPSATVYSQPQYPNQVRYAPPQSQNNFYSQPNFVGQQARFSGAYGQQNFIDAPVGDRLPPPLQPTLIPTPIQTP